jgi:AcrR family transcriptional regulator
MANTEPKTCRRLETIVEVEEKIERPVRTVSPRDPARTKRSILDAATAEFVEKGFAGASVNEIADRAKINKRMLYHYFGKKESLFLHVFDEVYVAMRAEQCKVDLANLSPAQAIETLIRFTWNYNLRKPDFMSLFIANTTKEDTLISSSETMRRANEPFMDMIARILRDGAQSGVFRKNIEPIQLYLTVASLCTGFVATRVGLSQLLDHDFTSQEATDKRLDHIVEVVLGYLRP